MAWILIPEAQRWRPPEPLPPAAALWLERVLERDAQGRLLRVPGMVRHPQAPFARRVPAAGPTLARQACRLAEDHLARLAAVWLATGALDAAERARFDALRSALDAPGDGLRWLGIDDLPDPPAVADPAAAAAASPAPGGAARPPADVWASFWHQRQPAAADVAPDADAATAPGELALVLVAGRCSAGIARGDRVGLSLVVRVGAPAADGQRWLAIGGVRFARLWSEATLEPPAPGWQHPGQQPALPAALSPAQMPAQLPAQWPAHPPGLLPGALGRVQQAVAARLGTPQTLQLQALAPDGALVQLLRVQALGRSAGPGAAAQAIALTLDAFGEPRAPLPLRGPGPRPRGATAAAVAGATVPTVTATATATATTTVTAGAAPEPAPTPGVGPVSGPAPGPFRLFDADGLPAGPPNRLCRPRPGDEARRLQDSAPLRQALPRTLVGGAGGGPGGALAGLPADGRLDTAWLQVRCGPVPPGGQAADQVVTLQAGVPDGAGVYGDQAAAVQAFWRGLQFFDRLQACGLPPAGYFRHARLPLVLHVRAPVTGVPGGDLPAAEVMPFFPADMALDAGADPDALRRADGRLQLALLLGAATAQVRWRADARSAAAATGADGPMPDVAALPGRAQGLGIAADPRWVWHELGHVLQYASTGELQLAFAHGVGDALAAIACDPALDLAIARSPARGNTYPWVPMPNRRHDRRPAQGYGWCGRRNRVRLDAGPDRGPHQRGYFEDQLLSSSLFRLYRSLGGDSWADAPRRRGASARVQRLVLQALALMGPDAVVPVRSADQFVSALIEADALASPALGGGLHKLIRWAFERQGLYATDDPAASAEGEGLPPRVDVYLPDARPGQGGAAGPSSPSGPSDPTRADPPARSVRPPKTTEATGATGAGASAAPASDPSPDPSPDRTRDPTPDPPLDPPQEPSADPGGYAPVPLDWAWTPDGRPPGWQADPQRLQRRGGQLRLSVCNRGQDEATGLRLRAWLCGGTRQGPQLQDGAIRWTALGTLPGSDLPLPPGGCCTVPWTLPPEWRRRNLWLLVAVDADADPANPWPQPDPATGAAADDPPDQPGPLMQAVAVDNNLALGFLPASTGA